MEERKKTLMDWRDVATILGLWSIVYAILAELKAFSFEIRLGTLLLPILIIIIQNQVKIYNDRKFILVRRENLKGSGPEFLKYIESAKEYIWVTHFRKERPIKSYIEALDFATTNSKIKIRRIVAADKPNLGLNDYTTWILEEIQKKNNDHRFFPLKGNQYFELFSIDGNIAAIALPSKSSISSGELPFLLVSKDKDFIQAIEAIYEELWSKSKPLKN